MLFPRLPKPVPDFLIQVDPKLSFAPELELLLRRWTVLIEDYAQNTRWPGWQDKTDVPYWYTERANVGILAAAAWQCGFHALEEWNETKKWEGDDYSGRYDLAVHFRREEVVSIEAKQAFLWLGPQTDPDTTSGEIISAMENAMAGATLMETQWGDRMGIAFLIPGVLPSLSSADAWEKLAQGVAKLGDLDLLAWASPRIEAGARAQDDHWRDRGPTPRYDDRFYPGVLLVGRLAKSD